jgi:uncharacterized membrane protein YeaQ/YmgE (transglycosylase-associated protein family)
MSYFVMLITGGVLGLIVGLIRKDGFYGDIGEILIGMLGGLIGGFVFTLFAIETPYYLGEILSSIAGAGIVLTGLSAFRTT